MIVVREEELVEQALVAEKAAQQAHEMMLRAEARSAAAEAAKIELSLRLAAALSEQEAAEDVSAVPSAPERHVSHALFLLAPEVSQAHALRRSDVPAKFASDVLHLWCWVAPERHLRPEAMLRERLHLCRSCGQLPGAAVQRVEELELAASVASRRAAAAEAELHRTKQRLDFTDKRAKELAWQVGMLRRLHIV